MSTRTAQGKTSQGKVPQFPLEIVTSARSLAQPATSAMRHDLSERKLETEYAQLRNPEKPLRRFLRENLVSLRTLRKTFVGVTAVFFLSGQTVLTSPIFASDDDCNCGDDCTKVLLVDSHRPLVVRYNEIKYIKLPSMYQFESLEFDVEAIGTYDASAVVYVNNRREGSLFAPGNEDPKVTIGLNGEEETQTIKIVGEALPRQYGTIKITRLVGYVRNSYLQPQQTSDQYYECRPRRLDPEVSNSFLADCDTCNKISFKQKKFSNAVAESAYKITVLVDRLYSPRDEGSVSTHNYTKFLHPIKIAAVELQTIANPHGPTGPLGLPVQTATKALIEAVDKAHDFLVDEVITINSSADDYARAILDITELLRLPLLIKEVPPAIR